MRTLVELKCKLCGNSFHVRPYRRLTAMFCSALCRQRGNGKFNAHKISASRKRLYPGKGNYYIKQMGRHEHRLVLDLLKARGLQC